MNAILLVETLAALIAVNVSSSPAASAPAQHPPAFILMADPAVGSLWAQAGLRKGDTITHFDGCPVRSPQDAADKEWILEEPGNHIVELDRLGRTHILHLDEGTAPVLEAMERDSPRPQCRWGARAEDRIVPAFRAGGVIGMRIYTLKPGGDLERAGLLVGDTIVRIDGCEVGSPARFPLLDRLSKRKVDDKNIVIEVQRRRKDVAFITVDLTRPPVPQNNLPDVDGDRPSCREKHVERKSTHEQRGDAASTAQGDEERAALVRERGIDVANTISTAWDVVKALDLYRLQAGTYPSQAEGLMSLTRDDKGRKPIMNAMPVDAWGHAFEYRYPSAVKGMKCDVISLGPDGMLGTRDDVTVSQ